MCARVSEAINSLKKLGCAGETMKNWGSWRLDRKAVGESLWELRVLIAACPYYLIRSDEKLTLERAMA